MQEIQDTTDIYTTPQYECLLEGVRDIRKVEYLNLLNPQGAMEASSSLDSLVITSEVNGMRRGIVKRTKEYLESTIKEQSLK